jgi:phage/plasmid-like protein (TIGR03299 family)
MAHEITSTDSLFVTRKPAWHGLGTVVENAPTSADALRISGLDWRVIQAPVQWMDDDGTLRADDSFKVNYRGDNGALLGVVSKDYTVVQNNEAFSFTDYLLGEGVQYETAGSLKGGRATWVLAKMPEQKILQDEYNPYLLFMNGHDGTRAVTVCMTPVRVVCWNTVNLALRSAKQKWSFKHTANVHSRLTMAKQTMGLAGTYMEALEKRSEQLATIKVSPTEFNLYTEMLFPKTGTTVGDSKSVTNIERFLNCYYAPDLANFTGTAYGFMMAVADYASHKPIKNDRSRESHFVNTVAKPADLLEQSATFFAV